MGTEINNNSVEPKKKSLESFAFDSRWSGAHGIGRFSDELQKRIEFRTSRIGTIVRPVSPLDVFVTSLWMIRNANLFLFSPGFNAPIIGLRRYVFTIHDLNHIDTGGDTLSLFVKRLYYNIVMKNACRRSVKVLTVSEFSRNRIIEWSGLDSSRVVNVGNGVSDVFSPKGDAYQPGYSYVLCIGNRKAHKNEGRALEGFLRSTLPKTYKIIYSGEGSEELFRIADEYQARDRVVFSGRVSEFRLAELYRGADMLVFPSLYEGFGLPVVEAMACGTPVITSNVTSLPEVAGDAAILVDPLSIDEISKAIDLVYTNAELREALVKTGIERSRYFQWSSVAERVYVSLADVSQD